MCRINVYNWRMTSEDEILIGKNYFYSNMHTWSMMFIHRYERKKIIMGNWRQFYIFEIGFFLFSFCGYFLRRKLTIFLLVFMSTVFRFSMFSSMSWYLLCTWTSSKTKMNRQWKSEEKKNEKTTATLTATALQKAENAAKRYLPSSKRFEIGSTR